jgi:hypothetical protein
MKMSKRIGIAFASFFLAMAVLVSSAMAADLKMTALSSRPEMVSGGDTLVKIEVPDSVSLDKVTVTRNGVNVSRVFKPGSGHVLVGLVDGLKNGSNKLEARAGSSSASLTVTNYPITGPIFSGPRDTPFVCETAKSGLGEPLDTDCSIKTRVEFYYVSTSGKTNKLPDPKKYPADVATTTTLTGKTVPYVVRVETGTINRGVYQIALLDDPAKAKSEAYQPNDGWNGRLQISFGGGSGIGHHQGSMMEGSFSTGQGGPGPGGPGGGSSVIDKGYATISSSMLAYSTSGNDTLVAETAMMLKEHFIKRYGVPIYTIGSGGSGGAMLQHLLSQNYPGILDAIVTGASFPCGEDLAWNHMDPALLLHYFEGFPGGPIPEIFPSSTATKTVDWTEEQKVLVSGYNLKLHGLSWTAGNSEQYRDGGTNPVTAAWTGTMNNLYSEIPEDVYDPIANPAGIRATHFDAQKAMFGTDPQTGFAYRAWSNTGQQYGLVALNAGKITVAQFLDLNENIGGFDKDGYFQKERTKADDQGLINSYRTGRKFMGYHVHLPVLDLRSYGDWESSGNTHLSYHSFQTKMRLIHANGTDANRVLWTYGMNEDRSAHANGANPQDLGLEYMDKWLLTIQNDKSNDSYAQKVIKNKPAQFTDGFWDDKGDFVAEPSTLDPNSKRNKLYPFYGDTIIASGSPIDEEATECTLKTPQKSDYKASFTDEEWTRLNKIFKDGVCDYSRPGVHADIKSTPWLSYGPAPQIDYREE